MENVRIYIVALAALLFVTSVHAAEFGSPDEAKALAEKAEQFYKKNGLKELLRVVYSRDPTFLEKDLYCFVSGMDGVNRAHAAVPKLRGSNLLNVKDTNGVMIVQEMIKTVSSPNGRGWVDYKWPHPKTKKIIDKTTFVLKLDENHFLGVGAYKK